MICGNLPHLTLCIGHRRTYTIHQSQIDVCLYFIAAHRLKAIDLKFMSAIAARVALIPVIAKADSMTAEETVAFRREIMAECEKHKIPCVGWLCGLIDWVL